MIALRMAIQCTAKEDIGITLSKKIEMKHHFVALKILHRIVISVFEKMRAYPIGGKILQLNTWGR